MSIINYLPSSLMFLLAAGETYLLYLYMITNARAPEGTVFTLKTLTPAAGAILFASIGFVTLIPSLKTRLQEEILSRKIYWAGISFTLIFSILLVVAAILTGSVDYTQYQASVN